MRERDFARSSVAAATYIARMVSATGVASLELVGVAPRAAILKEAASTIRIMSTKRPSSLISPVTAKMPPNGMNAAVTFHRGLGVAVNLTGGHASNIASGVDLDKVSFMMGPRYTHPFKNWFGHDLGQPGGGRIFGEGLIGGVHSFNTVVPTAAGAAGAASSFVFQVGGGMDLPLRKAIGIRLFEADYVRSTLPNSGNSTQSDLRLAAGISFHFTN
jgi:hypothetical protein